MGKPASVPRMSSISVLQTALFANVGKDLPLCQEVEMSSLHVDVKESREHAHASARDVQHPSDLTRHFLQV